MAKYEAESTPQPRYITSGEKVVLDTDKMGSEVDAKTTLFLLYMLYDLNLVTRMQLKGLLKTITDGRVPSNLGEYLVKEAAKA